MLAFVDESGCTGMKMGSGSSLYFGVTTVFFEDRQEAIRCYDFIEDLKQVMDIKKEFRFSDCSHHTRIRFLTEMKQFAFHYFAIVVDKSRLSTDGLKFNKPFLQFPVTSLFAQYANMMRDTTVVIDQTGSSEFRKGLKTSLKNDINSRYNRTVIKKVKTEHSHAHNLLQVADMICGAVTRSFHSHKKGASVYREIVQRKELSVTVWP